MAANLLPPFADPIAVDIFDTTQSGSVTSAADQVLTLTKVVNNNSGTPTTIPTAGYIALDVNDSSKFEIAFYDSLNVGAKTVRLHVRGIAGGANAHSASPCRMNMVASYLNDLAQAINSTNAARVTKVKVTDQGVTGTTTLTDDTALSFAVASGETWNIQADLIVDCSSADFKVALATTGALSIHLLGYEALPTLSGVPFISTGGVGVTKTFTPGASPNILRIYGGITASANGTIKLQFAPSSGAATATVYRGSSLLARKV